LTSVVVLATKTFAHVSLNFDGAGFVWNVSRERGRTFIETYILYLINRGVSKGELRGLEHFRKF